MAILKKEASERPAPLSILGGAAFGAIVGGLAGGGAGAGIGAASGGALGLGAHALTHDKEIDLKPEQLLQFRTAAPLDVKVMVVDDQQLIPQAVSPPRLAPPCTTVNRLSSHTCAFDHA